MHILGEFFLKDDATVELTLLTKDPFGPDCLLFISKNKI